MSLTGLVLFIKKYASKTFSWLKLSLTDSDTGKTIELTGDNATQIVGSKDIVINNNTTLNIYINKNDDNYSRESQNDCVGEVGLGIERHEGYGITFDQGVSVIRNTTLSKQQNEIIKMFKKLGWSEDILKALAIAYKIMILEDQGKHDKAKGLMEEAFRSKQGSNIRKMYNLARSGYIDGFVMGALFSPASYGPKWVLDTLNYFPEAIFVDENSSKIEIVEELRKRHLKAIPKVSLFARGKKIETLMNGYSMYLDKSFNSSEDRKGSPFQIYLIEEKEDYKIGWSEAKRLVLKLQYVREATPELLQKWASDFSKA